MSHKQALFLSADREKLPSGATQVADAAHVTLGRDPSRCRSKRKWGAPIVCNDRVTIAKDFDIADAEQNLGAGLLVNRGERQLGRPW